MMHKNYCGSLDLQTKNSSLFEYELGKGFRLLSAQGAGVVDEGTVVNFTLQNNRHDKRPHFNVFAINKETECVTK